MAHGSLVSQGPEAQHASRARLLLELEAPHDPTRCQLRARVLRDVKVSTSGLADPRTWEYAVIASDYGGWVAVRGPLLWEAREKQEAFRAARLRAEWALLRRRGEVVLCASGLPEDVLELVLAATELAEPAELAELARFARLAELPALAAWVYPKSFASLADLPRHGRTPKADAGQTNPGH